MSKKDAAPEQPASAKKTAIGYIRVSTDKQELGPEAQSAAIREWCTQNKVQLLSEHREVCSGGTKISFRDTFLYAVRKAEAEGASYFLVAKRDRLARDVVQAGVAEQMITGIGCRLLAIDDPAGHSLGPEAHLIRVILDAFAEFERARITLRIREALHVKRAKGERVGPIPYGKRMDQSEPGSKLLVDDEHEQKVIRCVIDMRMSGDSVNVIARALTERGYLTRAGKEFSAVQLMRIITKHMPKAQGEPADEDEDDDDETGD